MNKVDLAIIGGGAAGFFGAIRFAEFHPNKKIIVLEKKGRFLEKVAVSGGGRCNVTNAWNEPRLAADYYPRGHVFLQDAFAQFHCSDMRNWLDDHGVPTTVEADGRVFPSSNQSSSITNCFISETEKHDIEILSNCGLKSLNKSGDLWLIETDSENFSAKNILIATGSNRPVWEMLKGMGHQINSPVASLFAFTVREQAWRDLAGISVQNATVSLNNSDFLANGPLLITHRGVSGPAVLKLSAWAARELEKRNYRFDISISWTGISSSECLKKLKVLRDEEAKKNPALLNPFSLPKRLNHFLFERSQIQTIKMGEIGNKALQNWADILCNSQITIEGKVTNKDEFVTCGGVDLQEVDSNTMESEILKGVFFAGEVLDIDAITGGFNFQACWSGANLAAKSMS